MWGVLWALVVLFVALWLIGLFAHVFAGVLWWFLVIAVVLFVVNLLFGRPTRV